MKLRRDNGDILKQGEVCEFDAYEKIRKGRRSVSRELRLLKERAYYPLLISRKSSYDPVAFAEGALMGLRSEVVLGLHIP